MRVTGSGGYRYFKKNGLVSVTCSHVMFLTLFYNTTKSYENFLNFLVDLKS